MLTTHYLDEAARLCDRLVIMDKGVTLIEGAPADLVKQYVGDEIIWVNKSAEMLAGLEAHGIPHEVTGDTIQIATDSSREITNILLDSCQPKKMLTRMATRKDVSLKFTGRTLRD